MTKQSSDGGPRSENASDAGIEKLNVEMKQLKLSSWRTDKIKQDLQRAVIKCDESLILELYSRMAITLQK